MKIASELHAFWKKHLIKIYGAMYTATIVISLLCFMIQGQRIEKGYTDGKYVQESVTIHRFEMIDCEVIDDLTFKGVGDNARLVYNGAIDTLYMDCMYSYGLKEFVVYYNTTGDYNFPQENILKPKQFKHYLIYDFPKDTKQVSLPFPNSQMHFNELLLNSRDHVNKYGATMSDLFLIAIVPSLVFCGIDLVFSFFSSTKRIIKKFSSK